MRQIRPQTAARWVGNLRLATRRVLAGVLLVALLAGCGGERHAPAPPSSETGAETLAIDAGAKPALWLACDADTKLWLFGSVHVLPQGLAWRSAGVARALAQADTLMLETDASPGAQSEIAALARAYGLQPHGERLSAQLPAPMGLHLRASARELGIGLAELDALKPWRAALRISLTVAQKSGRSGANGVEPALLEAAQKGHKKLAFFESAREQIETLALLDHDAQIRFLDATLRQSSEGAQTFAALEEAWSHGDVAALERLIEPEFSEAGPVVYGALIKDRNARWSIKLWHLLDAPGEVFIAVGAAHLSGPDSVQNLLMARGVRVMRADDGRGDCA